MLADELMSRGKLVPDDLVNQMVAERVCMSRTTARGYILDGFPRTLDQAEWLDARLRAALRRTLPVVAISIVGRRRELLQAHHRTPHLSGLQAHLQRLHATRRQVAGICDVDGTQL